jgi:hypothetical protein
MQKGTAKLISAVLSAVLLLAGVTAVLAAHTGGNVPLLDTSGNPVSGTTPYSPKATCGVCHNYGSGDKFSTHVQGVLEADNKVYWQAYQTKSFEHGVSVGRHSNQGRNEDYNNAFRAAVGDPFFTSSPGMFGKY